MKNLLVSFVPASFLYFSPLTFLIIYFMFISFPPTEWITRNYFEAIISRQMWRALAFSYSQRWPNCTHYAELSAKDDMALYSDAEVRNVNVTISRGGGSDDTIEWGRVDFEYRKPGVIHFDRGQIVLMTLFDDFGFRYTCGGHYMYP